MQWLCRLSSGSFQGWLAAVSLGDFPTWGQVVSPSMHVGRHATSIVNAPLRATWRATLPEKKKKKRRSSQSTTFYVPCDPAQWVVDATTIQPRLWPLYFSVTQFPGEHGCRISRKTLKRWFFTTSRRQPRNCSTPNSEVIIAFSSLRNSSGL